MKLSARHNSLLVMFIACLDAAEEKAARSRRHLCPARPKYTSQSVMPAGRCVPKFLVNRAEW